MSRPICGKNNCTKEAKYFTWLSFAYGIVKTGEYVGLIVICEDCFSSLPNAEKLVFFSLDKFEEEKEPEKCL